MISGASAAAGGTSGATACAPATAGVLLRQQAALLAGTTCPSVATAGGFLVAAAFQAAALRFLVFAVFVPAAFSLWVLAAFLPTTLNFRVRTAFFFAALRFVGMGIPLVTGVIWRRSYNAYLLGVQGVRLWRRQRVAHAAPRIHPSISAVLRSCGSSSGRRNFSRLPSASARRSHSAVAKASRDESTEGVVENAAGRSVMANEPLHAGAHMARISDASRSVFEESPVRLFVSHEHGINAVPVVHNFLLCLVEGEVACANLIVKIVFDLVLIPSTTVRNRRIVGFRP